MFLGIMPTDEFLIRLISLILVVTSFIVAASYMHLAVHWWFVQRHDLQDLDVDGGVAKWLNIFKFKIAFKKILSYLFHADVLVL